MPNKPLDELDPEQYTGLVRAALHPDERKFFKEYLGQESPDISDYLLPQGRFAGARSVREDIVRQTLHNMIPSANNPQATLGDAQSIMPNFPVPPSAMRPTGPELQGPGAPVRPLQGINPSEHDPGFMNGLDPNMQEEGPRPRALEPDMNSILPRSHQNLLVQKTHQFGLRPVQASAATRKADMEVRYRDIMTGADTEDYPGEAADMRVKLGLEQKGVLPDSAKGRTLAANATIAEEKAKLAGPQAQATLNRTQAATNSSNANTQTQNTLRQARLAKLEAQAELAHKQSTLAGDLSSSEKHKQDMLKFGVMKWLHAQGHLSNDEIDTGLNSMETMKGKSGLQFEPEDISGLKEMLGFKRGIHMSPRDQPAQAVAPTGDPMQIPGGVIMPQQQGDLMNPEPVNPNGPGAQAEPMDKKAMAKALYDRMKEGDTQTFDGVKYKKQGSKLVRVQ